MPNKIYSLEWLNLANRNLETARVPGIFCLPEKKLNVTFNLHNNCLRKLKNSLTES